MATTASVHSLVALPWKRSLPTAWWLVFAAVVVNDVVWVPGDE